MSQYIEEKLSTCNKCGCETIHRRSNNKSSGFALLVHLLLIIITAGIWLIPLLIIKVLSLKFGGWTCSSCKK